MLSSCFSKFFISNNSIIRGKTSFFRRFWLIFVRINFALADIAYFEGCKTTNYCYLINRTFRRTFNTSLSRRLTKCWKFTTLIESMLTICKLLLLRNQFTSLTILLLILECSSTNVEIFGFYAWIIVTTNLGILLAWCSSKKKVRWALFGLHWQFFYHFCCYLIVIH